MGRAGSRLSRLARVRHHPRRTAFTGRPAPHPARPTNPTPPTELTTEPPNRHHTNRIRRHRIASQRAGPTSGDMYTANVTPPQYFAVEPVDSSSLVVAGHGRISITGELPFSATR